MGTRVRHNERLEVGHPLSSYRKYHEESESRQELRWLVTACTIPYSAHSKPSYTDLEYREDETPSDRPQLQTLFANRPIAIQQYYWNRNT